MSNELRADVKLSVMNYYNVIRLRFHELVCVKKLNLNFSLLIFVLITLVLV